MEIVLIRHGKPDVDTLGRVKAKDLRELIEAYQASGISGDPPVIALQKAQQCNAVVCSDFPRSIQSSEALGVEMILPPNALFREAELPHTAWGGIALPPNAWLVIFRALWLLGYSANGESFALAKQRAKLGAENLIMSAKDYGSVMLVGHGLMNRLITRELIASGWIGPVNPGMRHWEFEIYRNRER